MTRLLTGLISFFKRLSAFASRRKIERDVDDELAFHLAMKEAAGSDRSGADAARAARRQFGNVTLYQEQTREMWTFPSVESIAKDVRYALRGLRRAPGFSIVAILALALGIGANIAIYSLVHGVLINGLPYRDSGRLVLLIGDVEREKVERRGNSYPDHLDWRRTAKSFEDIGAYTDTTTTLQSSGEPERLTAEFVTPSYFPILGVSPQTGRAFREDENVVANRDNVVILSDALWKRSFGGDPNVINSKIILGGNPFVVVGIMPPGFTGLTDSAQLWLPWVIGNSLTNRGARGFNSVARLKPGVTLAAAQAEMTTISAALAKAYPDTNEKRSVEVSPLSIEAFSGLRAPLMSLMAAVVFVLLIACANVANLMVTRADVRAKEIALRTALGAGRARIVRQLVTEGVVLSMTGALVGLGIAVVALRTLIATSPVTLPSFAHPDLDLPVLLFAVGLAMATGVLLGLAPAMHTRVSALNDALKAAARGSSRGGTRSLRGWLVVVEVALTVVLSVGAGLMIRSAQKMSAIEPGFATDHVLTLNVSVPRQPVTTQAAPPAPGVPAPPPPFVVDWRTLMDRVASVPGVTSAALGSDAPLTGQASAVFYSAEGDTTAGATRQPRAYVHRVSPNFFSTLGIAFRAGRTFTDSELAAPPDNTPVIVTEPLARRFWPGDSPIGKRIKIGNAAAQNPWMTIVGVVPELKYRALPDNPTADPDFFMPMTDRGGQTFVIRTTQPPASLGPSVRAAIHGLSGALVPFAVQPMDELARNQTAPARFTTWVLGFFAVGALLLAVIGLYGVVSYLVDQREKEFSIRLALGAARSSIVALVFREAGLMVGIGLALGSAAAWQVSRLIESQLFGVTVRDSSSVIAVGLLALVAMAACIVPAIRATRVAPVTALRSE